MVMVSAALFGATPILGKLSYRGGSNAVTLTFLRAALAAPALILLLVRRKELSGLSARLLKQAAVIGALGPAATTLLLYGSYGHIPVSVATALHFCYPVVVVLAQALLFRERLGRGPLVGAALCAAGVALLSGGGAASPIGVAMAIGSGFTYAVYIIGVERTELRRLRPLSLSLCFCLVSMAVSGLFGAVTGQLTFRLTPAAWGYSLLVALLVSVGAVTLFQRGILVVGATAAAVLSTLEPILSAALGALLLREPLHGRMVAGCLLVCAGVAVMVLARARQTERRASV